MLYNFVVIILCAVISVITVKKIYKNEFDKKNKIIILEILIFFVGFLIRLLSIDKFPNALNVDEASEGYEAFSILKYAVDRHENHLPVFFVAWGGGQNVLLAYMMLPFIQFLGLNLLSVRLPMAILSCFSIVFMYLILERIKDRKFARYGLVFFVICPWHIMKSRWGLESNVFPDLFLMGVYFLIRGIQDKNKIAYYVSFAVFGLTGYAYGTAYVFLPIFVFAVLITLLIKKEIRLKEAFFAICIVGIIALPIMLCVVINKFNLPQFEFLGFCIPKLAVKRYENISSIFSSNFFADSFKNFFNTLKIIIYQDDGLPWNSLPISGTTYKISLVFTIIGIFVAFGGKIKEKIEMKYNYIINIWFISAVLLSFFCDPNINRINIIWIPIIYYTILGIYAICSIDGGVRNVAILLYLVLFINFGFRYFAEDANSYWTFEANLDKVITETEKMDKKIYISNNVKEPYIYVLFYGKYNPHDFANTVLYYEANEEFQEVKSFGKYDFQGFESLDDENGVYVVREENLKEYNIEKDWKKRKIAGYVLFYRK